MQVGQPALLDNAQGVVEHRVGLGRKSGNQICPEHDIRPGFANSIAKTDRILTRMPPLHALQDHVVA